MYNQFGITWLKISPRPRGLTPEKVNEIADNFAIRSPKDAMALNIIDSIKYKDEVIDELVTLTGAQNPDKLEVMKMEKYFGVKSTKKQKKDKRQKIAVIYASGEIGMGKGDSQSIGSETISKAIRKARRDSTIKAIVLRVNSPGGSALASDIIWREALLAKQTKPFIVSMGDVAASGGYYIACPADVIVANPTTITGSIGVFGLMLNTQKLMNQKLGITFDGIKTNKYADLPNLTRPMTEDEKAIIQNEVESIYDIFIEHVGQGRNMTKISVDSIGQGRVWSGVNAKNIGLIDEFGGLERAIAIAAEKAGLAEYKTVEYPELGDPFEEIIKQLTGETRARILQGELAKAMPFTNN
jgi:protease IV